jgi:hypothetical protein
MKHIALVSGAAMAVATQRQAWAQPPKSITLPHLPSISTLHRRASAEDHPAEPNCFGYQPTTHQFVCLAYDVIANQPHVSGDDQMGNLVIELIGPSSRTSWVVRASPAFAAEWTTTTVRSVIAELNAVKVRRRNLERKQLTEAWTKLAGVALRYVVQVHEGDASFGYHARLRMTCGNAAPIDDKDGFELNFGQLPRIGPGPTAVAFASPDKRFFALSVVGEGGGEGAIGYSLSTFLIDVDASCRQHAVVVSTEPK